MSSEKKSLLAEEEKADKGEQPQVDYGSSSSSGSVESAVEDIPPDCIVNSPFLVKIYLNRKRIPGYGLWSLLRQASLYSIYVLIVLLIVYLLNQLDRYTLPITIKYIGFQIGFGNLSCLPNFTLMDDYKVPRSFVYDELMKNCSNLSQ